MILHRNPLPLGLAATTFTLAVIAALMGSIILLFCFPVIGQAVADWVGHSRFAVLIQLLY